MRRKSGCLLKYAGQEDYYFGKFINKKICLVFARGKSRKVWSLNVVSDFI